MRFLEIADTVDKNNTRLYNADMTQNKSWTEMWTWMESWWIQGMGRHNGAPKSF